MVVPIIAGGAILAFVTWGKELFGAKTFNDIMKGLILLSIGILAYIGYKMYKVWDDAKTKTEEVVEGVTETFGDVWNQLIEAGERGQIWVEESKLVREEAVEKLDPYLGIKTGIAPGSLEARQKELGQKIRTDILNTPTWIKEKLMFW